MRTRMTKITVSVIKTGEKRTVAYTRVFVILTVWKTNEAEPTIATDQQTATVTIAQNTLSSTCTTSAFA